MVIAKKSNKTSASRPRQDEKSSNKKKDIVVQRYLEAMSIADMIGQMSQIDINMLLTDENNKHALDKTKVERYIGELGIGSVLNYPSNPDNNQQWTARQYREAAIELNEVAAKYKRPPVLWGLDSVHGANYIRNATLTPQPLNLAATFNTTTAKQAGRMASRDTRAAGIHWLFAPLVGVAIHPSWSRVYETFGEDPVLVGEMALAMIQGIQEPDVDDASNNIPSVAAACAKHFVGYSAPRDGHDRSPSWIPTRHLYQYFVPPWKKVIRDGKVRTVMESYTETDGVPNVANRQALNYLLRQRLQFDGVLVTDYQEVHNLYSWHHITANDETAVVQSLTEGSVDMSMVPVLDSFAKSIVEALKTDHNALTKARIQESAQRVLQLKHDLKMLNNNEPITIVNNANLDRVGTDNVLSMVHDSLILTENRHNLLPLEKQVPERLKIHVTGPTANSLVYQTGGWSGQWQGAPNDDWFSYGSTVWDSLHAESLSSKSSWSVTYTCGTDILGKDCNDPDETHKDEGIIDQVKHWAGLTPTTSIAKAVQAAQDADITIICVGEESYTEKPGDIRSLHLAAGQYDLVHAIRRNTDSNAQKIILVYFGGRPRLLSDMVDNVDAVLLGFLPGPDAGKAVVDVIAGRVNPSGCLPITYPLADDGGGVPYWHAVSDQCTRDDDNTLLPHYESIPCPVQWPFGHGLSYTTFVYSDFSAIGGIDADLEMKVTVKNTGRRAGAETVMFFTFDEFRLTTPEYKRLRAFEKVMLAAGESITIKKTVPVDELRFVGPHDDRHYILDPHMISYVGVGVSTDCRQRDDTHNPDENQLCVRLQSQAPDKPYVAACEAACDLWKESNCSGEFGMTDKACLEMCMSIGKSSSPTSVSSSGDGWGWNYVNCLESVVWGMQQQQQQRGDTDTTSSCWMMTSLCRNVFQTGQLTEFGAAGLGSSSANQPVVPSGCLVNERGTTAYYVALLSAIAASVLMMQLIRGVIGRKAPRSHDDEEERFKEIQFTTLNSGVVD